MIKIQEENFNKEINSVTQTIDDEWRKYNKRMDDMIDDVEIEAEIEAEKKIRSKNSKLLTISITGVTLLILIFIKVQQHSSIPQIKIDKKPLNEKAVFPTRKTSPINSQADQIAPVAVAPLTQLATASVKSKNIIQRVNGSSTPKHIKIGKTSKAIFVKQTINGPNGKHYVQLGAFSIKKNAEKFVKKVNAKGFNTVISVRDTKPTQYQVFIGNFIKINNSDTIRADLKASGFTSSIKKVNNAYILDLGTFRNSNGLNSLVEKLQDKGFKPKVKKISTENKTYNVRVEGLETKNEAQKTRQELADQGFKNSFIR